MVSSSAGGIMRRISASTASARRAVSSMRVPVGARMCRRICPASTVGKKSRPKNGNSAHESTQKPRNSTMKRARCESTDESTSA